MKAFSITRHHHAKSARKADPAKVCLEATTTTTPGQGGKSMRIIGFDPADGYRRYSIDLSPDLVALIVKVHTLNTGD